MLVGIDHLTEVGRVAHADEERRLGLDPAGALVLFGKATLEERRVSDVLRGGVGRLERVGEQDAEPFLGDLALQRQHPLGQP